MRTNLLILVIALAFVVRVYHLGSLPPSLTPDEASLGFNAYSILKTGKDEYGVPTPLVFKSFGDYKPGLYVYTVVPVVAILGLNEFSVRLPSAIAGTIAVLLIYLIIGQLKIGSTKLQITSALVMALSPWSIMLSRGAWEVNLSLTLTLAGIYFFFQGLPKHKFLYLSSVVFGLTLWAYQGAKLSTLIVIMLLLLLWGKDLLRNKKSAFMAGLIGFFVCLPIIVSLFFTQTGRLTVFSVLSYPRPQNYLQQQLQQGNEQIGDLSYYLYHSESLNFLRGIMGRYFNHFSGRFLFFEGDWQNPRHTPPNHGVLYLADAILLLVGIYSLARKKVKREIMFVILWLLLAPLPAALSRDQVHAVRSFQMLAPIVILVATGITTLPKKLLYLIIPLYLVSIIYFVDAYAVHLPIHNAKYWQWGYKELVQTITSQKGKYDHIYVEQSYEQPYIYFLFYAASGANVPTKYDPGLYQKQAQLMGSQNGDVGWVTSLDGILFTDIDWSALGNQKNVLIAARMATAPNERIQNRRKYNILKDIYYPQTSEIAWRVLEVNK
jgi:4-amino-4-deoxy-L-arabinose transferase-like glycosyltransferase